MSADSIESLFALAIGFAIAGVLATGYQAVTSRPASFRLLRRGPQPATFAAVPLLAFAAPFIIMRNTIRGHRILGGPVHMVMLATNHRRAVEPDVGHGVVMALGAVGFPVG
jgi:hypothetical protein